MLQILSLKAIQNKYYKLYNFWTLKFNAKWLSVEQKTQNNTLYTNTKVKRVVTYHL